MIYDRVQVSGQRDAGKYSAVQLGCVQPGKNGAKRLLNGNGDVLYTVLMTQGLQPWQLRRPFIVFFLKELSKPDEIGINTCLILQNTLDVTVTAVLNKTEHPTRVKGSVETGS